MLVLVEDIAGTLAAAIALAHFDLYCRPSGIVSITLDQCLPPQAETGAATWWAMILFPPTADDVSQVGLQDDPILVGHSNPKRLWLSEVIASVYRRHSRRTTPGVDEPPLLFGLSVAEYSRLFRRACITAQVPEAVPH